MDDLPIEEWSPEKWKRDSEHPCDGFEKGKPLYWETPDCETDGHYMCDECKNARRCPKCNAVWDGGGCRNGCVLED